MDQIAKDVGVDLHTESLLLRAEQLAKLEYDKNIDKVRVTAPAAAIVSTILLCFIFRVNSYCSVTLTRRRCQDIVYIAIILTEKYKQFKASFCLLLRHHIRFSCRTHFCRNVDV